MLTKNKHAKVNYISRLLVLPLATIVFIGISCKVEMDPEKQKTPDEIVATAPSDAETGLLDDSGAAVYFDNKKVMSLAVAAPEDKPVYIKLSYKDGSNENISMEAAVKAGLPVPPPPPPPPPPIQVYNGKVLKYASLNTEENKVKIYYDDGSEEKISPEEAKKAKLDFIRFTPPKVVKDSIVRFAPPKVVKDKDVTQQDLSGRDKVFNQVEQEASFPGGPQKWAQYITKTIAAEIDVFGDKDFGTCVVKFIVDKHGNVSDVTATTMKGTLLAKVSVDAIRNGPKWFPAMQNDIPVNAYRLQPVTLTNPDR